MSLSMDGESVSRSCNYSGGCDGVVVFMIK